MVAYRASEAPAMFVRQQACSPFELNRVSTFRIEQYGPMVARYDHQRRFGDVVLCIAPLRRNFCPTSNSFSLFSPGQMSSPLHSLCDGIKPDVSSGSTYCIPTQLPVAVESTQDKSINRLRKMYSISTLQLNRLHSLPQNHSVLVAHGFLAGLVYQTTIRPDVYTERSS